MIDRSVAPRQAAGAARSAYIRYGKGSTAITLTTDGVKFGAGKVLPRNALIVRKLIDALVKDRKKAQGELLLRAALHISNPILLGRRFFLWEVSNE